jgi:hypothetical protein
MGMKAGSWFTRNGSNAPSYERASAECANGLRRQERGWPEAYVDYNCGFVAPTYTGELLIKCHR